MNAVTDNKQDEVDKGGSDDGDSANAIDALRRFHYGEPVATANTTKPAGDVLPALLNPYRDASAIRYQYPLYLAPPDDADEATLAKPAGEYLLDLLETLAPGDADARILKDNFPWIERHSRQQLPDPDPLEAAAVFAAAAAAILEQLDLNQSSRESLAADLERLGDAIVPGGKFLGYGPHSSLHLMVHAIRHRCEHQRAAFRHQIDKYIHGLRSLLDIEKAKASESSKTGNGGVGAASQYLDTCALSGMLEQRSHGSLQMSDERRERIANDLEELQGWQDYPVLVKFVGKLDDPSLASLPVLDVIESNDPCATSIEIFTHDAAIFARLFAAARIASLEINGNYNPAIHDSLFASFDWQAFSREEMKLVTRLLALVSADQLSGDGLPSFTHMLG